jgi:hypothetical protein
MESHEYDRLRTAGHFRRHSARCKFAGLGAVVWPIYLESCFSPLYIRLWDSGVSSLLLIHSCSIVAEIKESEVFRREDSKSENGGDTSENRGLNLPLPAHRIEFVLLFAVG